MSNILFLGDFYYDYDYVTDDIIEISKWINSNNYKTILNLEGPLSNSGEPTKKRGPNIHQSTKAIEVLKRLNVIGVLLANNHTMDFGIQGLTDTLEILVENDIKYAGAGLNLEDAIQPMKLSIDDKNVYVHNHAWDIEEAIYATNKSPGCAPREQELIIEVISNLRRSDPSSTIISTFHWGFEYNPLPMPYDISLAHRSIEAGSDLVIGGHPHIIQPKERFKNKYIYYSLGNFYFGSKRSNFEKRKFKGTIPNLCDYGAMIALDLVDKSATEGIIKYDTSNMESILLNKTEKSSTIIEDISDIDYLKSAYIKQAKSQSININPILTMNKHSNKIKIAMLRILYKAVEVRRKFQL